MAGPSVSMATRRPWTPRTLLALPLVRFILAGGANAALTSALFWGLLRAFAASPHAAGLAQATSYGVGIVLSFAVNRRWTFRSEGAVRGEAVRFVVAHLSALTLSSLVLQAAISKGHMPVAPAWLGVAALTTVANFVVQRRWVFRTR